MSSSKPALSSIAVVALIGALFVSTLGDEIALVALVFRVEAVSSSGFLIGVLLSAQLVPMLLLGPLAGQLIDRLETTRVLAVALVLEGLLLSILSATQDVKLLLIGAFVLGSLFAVSGPAIFTLVPVIAEQSSGEWTPARANTVFVFIRSSGSLFGPVLGGAIADFGTSAALLIDAATFFATVPVLLVSGIRRHASEVTSRKHFEGALEGIRLLLRDRVFRVLLPVLEIAVFASSVSDVAFIFFVRGPLDSGGLVYGLLISAWATGMLAGALAGGASVFEPHLERPALSGAALIGVALLITGAVPVLGVVAAAFLLGGFANGLHNVTVRTLIHTRIPDRVHGRAFAAYAALTNAAVVAGFAVSGPFAVEFSRAVYVASGALCAIAGAFGLALLAVRRTPDY